MSLSIPTQNVTHVRGGPNGEKSYEVKRALVNAAKNADRTLVAAVTGKKIRVVGGQLHALADGSLSFFSATSGTPVTGSIPVDVAGASSGLSSVIDLDSNRFGCFETVAGELLGVTLSANTDLDGWILYIEI